MPQRQGRLEVLLLALAAISRPSPVIRSFRSECARYCVQGGVSCTLPNLSTAHQGAPSRHHSPNFSSQVIPSSSSKSCRQYPKRVAASASSALGRCHVLFLRRTGQCARQRVRERPLLVPLAPRRRGGAELRCEAQQGDRGIGDGGGHSGLCRDEAVWGGLGGRKVLGKMGRNGRSWKRRRYDTVTTTW